MPMHPRWHTSDTVRQARFCDARIHARCAARAPQSRFRLRAGLIGTVLFQLVFSRGKFRFIFWFTTLIQYTRAATLDSFGRSG
jgi:hypothetical protein